MKEISNVNILKKVFPNFLLMLVIVLVYFFVPFEKTIITTPIVASTIITTYIVIRTKAKYSFLYYIKRFFTSAILLGVLYWLFSLSSWLGAIWITIVVVGIAGWRIRTDLKRKDSLFMDSMRNIEEKIWGEPLDPMKKKRDK